MTAVWKYLLYRFRTRKIRVPKIGREVHRIHPFNDDRACFIARPMDR